MHHGVGRIGPEILDVHRAAKGAQIFFAEFREKAQILGCGIAGAAHLIAVKDHRSADLIHVSESKSALFVKGLQPAVLTGSGVRLSPKQKHCACARKGDSRRAYDDQRCGVHSWQPKFQKRDL